MRKLAALVLVIAAAPASAHAATPAPYAGQCGLPATQPIWADFGWPSDQFDPILGKPGIVLGASSGAYPAQMRAAGAATVYFDLNFNKRIGTTTKPADPATMQAKAQSLFTFAVQQTGCATPVIVLNELSGASLVTPWSDNNAQYRQNALAFVQALAALGAHPVLLVAARPYTGGDAAVWWQQAAASAELVREVYVPATATWKQGPVLGNRTLRDSYRQAVADFTAIGISPSRLGLMLSFATTHGFGGRNGLEPAEAWYEVAKWQALAVQAGRGGDRDRVRLVVGLGRVDRRRAGPGEAVRALLRGCGCARRRSATRRRRSAPRSTPRSRRGSSACSPPARSASWASRCSPTPRSGSSSRSPATRTRRRARCSSGSSRAPPSPCRRARCSPPSGA